MSRCAASLLIAMLAQREERGSNSATIVNVIVPASGKEPDIASLTYSRIAKRALACQELSCMMLDVWNTHMESPWYNRPLPLES